MTEQVTFGVIVTLAVAIFSHAGATVWWAAKISTSLEFMSKELIRLNVELKDRDKQFEAMWKRLDELRDKVQFNNTGR